MQTRLSPVEASPCCAGITHLAQVDEVSGDASESYHQYTALTARGLAGGHLRDPGKGGTLEKKQERQHGCVVVGFSFRHLGQSGSQPDNRMQLRLNRVGKMQGYNSGRCPCTVTLWDSTHELPPGVSARSWRLGCISVRFRYEISKSIGDQACGSFSLSPRPGYICNMCAQGVNPPL